MGQKLPVSCLANRGIVAEETHRDDAMRLRLHQSAGRVATEPCRIAIESLLPEVAQAIIRTHQFAKAILVLRAKARLKSHEVEGLE